MKSILRHIILTLAFYSLAYAAFAGEGVLSCKEAMTHLEADCTKGLFETTVKNRQKKDIIFANALWSYLSDEELFREKIFVLGKLASLRLDFFIKQGLFPVERLRVFVTEECRGLEIWADPDQPQMEEISLFSKRASSWWTLERFAAFMRYFFEIQKYFSKEENQIRENIGSGYFLKIQGFTDGSKKYRTFKAFDESINPFDKHKHKFRAKFHYSPKGELRKLLINHKDGALTKYRLKPESSIGKMNRLFGLPGGADISGTFVNNMWAVKYLVESLEEFNFLTPNNLALSVRDQPETLIWMGFLAAMVGQFHHTFNEVAIVLAIKGMISYQAGHYNSIFALGSTLESGLDLSTLIQLIEEAKVTVRDSFFFEDKFGSICRFQFSQSERVTSELIKRFTTITAKSYSDILRLPGGFLSQHDLKQFLMSQCERNTTIKKGTPMSLFNPQNNPVNEQGEGIDDFVFDNETDFKTGEDVGEDR